MLIRVLFVAVGIFIFVTPGRSQHPIDFREAARKAAESLLTVVDDPAFDSEVPVPVPDLDASGVPVPLQRLLQRQLRSGQNLQTFPGSPGRWNINQIVAHPVAIAVRNDIAIAGRIRGSEVTLQDQDGNKWQGRVAARDHAIGIVAIHIEAAGLRPLEVADQEPEAGLPVLISWIGDASVPHFEASMIGSGLLTDRPELGITQAMGVTYDPQKVRAPIVDDNGRLVGVVVVKGSQLRCQSVKQFNRLIDSVTPGELTELYRGRMGIAINDSGEGPMVGSVMVNTPAESGGIQAGDRLLEVNGWPCQSAADVMAAVAMSRAGDEIEVRIQRGEETVSQRIALAKIEPTTADEEPLLESLDSLINPQIFQFQDGKLVPVSPDALDSILDVAPPESSSD